MTTRKDETINWNTIEILLLDSDGVLTDGGVYLPETGGAEIRRFDIKDGFGITRLLETGFPIAVISRSPSTPVETRCEKLGIQHVFLAAKDKVACAEALLGKLRIDWSKAAFMGDDVPDLPLLEKVGTSLAPRNASSEVIEKVAWISRFDGGAGAVREVCDNLFHSRA